MKIWLTLVIQQRQSRLLPFLVCVSCVITCRDKAEVKLRESANQNISPPHGLDNFFLHYVSRLSFPLPCPHPLTYITLSPLLVGWLLQFSSPYIFTLVSLILVGSLHLHGWSFLFSRSRTLLYLVEQFAVIWIHFLTTPTLNCGMHCNRYWNYLFYATISCRNSNQIFDSRRIKLRVLLKIRIERDITQSEGFTNMFINNYKLMFRYLQAARNVF